jgi:hypothetical protein
MKKARILSGHYLFRKKMKKHILLFIPFVFFACKGEKTAEAVRDIYEIEVMDSLNNTVDGFLLSDVAVDIEIVPLQVDERYLYRVTHNIVVGDSDLFLCGGGGGGGQILRYNKKGELLNPVGSAGQGPSNHLYSMGLGIDDASRIVYVASAFGIDNQVKAYTYEGKYVKSTRMAPNGFELGGSKGNNARHYAFVDGKHILRRRLPVAYGDPQDLWLIQMRDTAGAVLSTFCDPANIGKEKEINEHRPDGIRLMPSYWHESSPVLNCYRENITFLFDSNDTIYRYRDNQLTPRYILHCGKRPGFEAIRKLDREWDYFSFLIVTDVLETKDHLFLVAEKDRFSCLLRVDKTDGSIQTLRREGEILESRMMGIRYRKAPEPRFTNDLCGGPPFFPYYQDNKRWIAQYEASELLEQIDPETLANTPAVMPEKRDELVRILRNLKEDDDAVLMIVTLK